MCRVGMLYLILFFSLVWNLSGCAPSKANTQAHDCLNSPSDFSVELFVDGLVASEDPQIARSHYLLQPDHRLHLALGQEAQKNNYPVRYLKLKYTQFEQLLKVVMQANLMAEPTSPYAEQVLNHQAPKNDKRPLLYLSITCWGKTNRYITTAADSPPTQVLLDRMILYTGRKLPDTTLLDAHRGY